MRIWSIFQDFEDLLVSKAIKTEDWGLRTANNACLLQEAKNSCYAPKTLIYGIFSRKPQPRHFEDKIWRKYGNEDKPQVLQSCSLYLLDGLEHFEFSPISQFNSSLCSFIAFELFSWQGLLLTGTFDLKYSKLVQLDYFERKNHNKHCMLTA